MKPSFFSTTLGKLTSAILIIAAALVLARWYVSESPRESNRVHHRAGYSVIHPQNWSADMRHGSGNSSPGIPATRDLINLSPDHYIGPEPALNVKRLVSAYDANVLKQSGWTDGMFQNQPALVFVKKQKRIFARAALFERGGQCFEVQETLPGSAELEDPQWWAFLETFKYPDGPIDPETSHPAPPATTSSAATQPLDF